MVLDIKISHLKCNLVLILCIIVLIFFTNCKKENSDFSAAEVMLPVEENIPHFNSDHLHIKKDRPFANLSDKPKELSLLHQYLENPGSISLEHLPILIDAPPIHSGFDMITIGNDRMILLDIKRNNIVEYDLHTQNSVTIAEFGRGPGDLHFPLEMKLYDNFIYVARQDGYISRFDCKITPCKFDEAISLEFIPVSLSPVGEKIAVLSSFRSSRSETDDDEEFETDKPIRIISNDGLQMDTFGDLYDAKEHSFLLSHPNFSRGFVRYSPEYHFYILTFSRFPFIYVYDADSLQIKKTYKISEFMLGKQRYLPDTGRLFTVDGDFSYIRNTAIINGSHLLVEKMTFRNRERDIMGILYDYNIDYYVVDLRDSEAFYIGGYEGVRKDNLGKSINVLPEGLIIYDYEDGSLFWAKI